VVKSNLQKIKKHGFERWYRRWISPNIEFKMLKEIQLMAPAVKLLFGCVATLACTFGSLMNR
jgi:hypothetical protein